MIKTLVIIVGVGGERGGLLGEALSYTVEGCGCCGVTAVFY